MSRGRMIDMSRPLPSVEDAILKHDWVGARFAMALKLARMFDGTDSAREVKAIDLSLAPCIDRCETMEAQGAQEQRETPLDGIMRMAESA